ncbi:MAG: hypothetical protein ABIK43_01475 [candidate division WOR-3 bacterium]
MTRLNIAVLLSVLTVPAVSQAADTLWTRTFFRGEQCVPAHTRCTNWTNYVTVGVSENGTMGTALLSYADDGTLLWSRYIKPHIYDQPTALAVDGSGNPLVGITADTMPQFSYLVRFNPAGETIWTRRIPNTQPRALAIDKGSNAYVIGYPLPAGQDSLWLARLDQYGNIVWSRNCKVATNHTVAGIGVDRFGNILAALSVTISGGQQPMLVKFNSEGSVVWKKQPSNIGSEFFSLAVESTGISYATTFSRLVKFDTAGNRVWSVTLPSNTARDVAIDEDGVYIAYANNYDFAVRMYTFGGQQVRSATAVRPTRDMPISLSIGHGQKIFVSGIAQDGSVYKAMTVSFLPLSGSVGVAEPTTNLSANALLRNRLLIWHAPVAGRYSFSFFDCRGALAAPVHTLHLASGDHLLSLPSSLAAGIHFLTVQTPEGTCHTKLITITR